MDKINFDKLSSMTVDEKLNTIMQRLDRIESLLGRKHGIFEKCKEEEQLCEKPKIFDTDSFNKAKRDLIIKAIDECGGNITMACDRLGIARATVYRYLKK